MGEEYMMLAPFAVFGLAGAISAARHCDRFRVWSNIGLIFSLILLVVSNPIFAMSPMIHYSGNVEIRANDKLCEFLNFTGLVLLALSTVVVGISGLYIPYLSQRTSAKFLRVILYLILVLYLPGLILDGFANV